MLIFVTCLMTVAVGGIDLLVTGCIKEVEVSATSEESACNSTRESAEVDASIRMDVVDITILRMSRQSLGNTIGEVTLIAVQE